MKAVLGIDTSCYTTSCALANQQFELMKAERMLLPVKDGTCGLRQSEAVFIHLKQLPQVLERLMTGVDADIAAVCVSSKPTDDGESYMPVFQAGLTVAKSLGASLRVPCYETTHQRGHLAAAHIGGKRSEGEYMALHLSGGTTDLMLVSGERLVPIASSFDLHAGQLVDRIGVGLGLPFPAGPELEKLALNGKARGRYGVSLSGNGCHLSGAEAQALRDIHQNVIAEDIAAEVFDFLARTVLRLLERESERLGISDTLIFGGVASSSLLRDLINKRVQSRRSNLRINFGRPEFSGDNAAGVALIGARQQFTDHR